MIYTGSKLKNKDNSGIKKVTCIKIFGGIFYQKAFTGDIIKVSLKGAKYNLKLKKKIKMDKKTQKALIITSKFNTKRLNNLYLKFDENRSILVDDQKKMLGSKIVSPSAKEIIVNYKKYPHLKKIIIKSKLLI